MSTSHLSGRGAAKGWSCKGGAGLQSCIKLLSCAGL